MDISEFERRLCNRVGDTEKERLVIAKLVDLCAEVLADGTEPMTLVRILDDASHLTVQESYSNEYYLSYLTMVKNVARRVHSLHELHPDLCTKFNEPPDDRPDGPPLAE